MEKQSGRAFTRVRIPVGARIRQDGREVEGTVTDISMNGTAIRCDWSGLHKGAPCRVELTLGEEEKITILAEGRVVRGRDDGVAIAFEAVDLESVPHLRNLILYNAEELDQVEHEFAEHMGIR
ncbi:MAG: PilZ domain-containing protein [Zetaproteobacteria bacterium]|nr:MAG: PilZ domain-containing protein [Zetaproteobacteria bacterium]